MRWRVRRAVLHIAVPCCLGELFERVRVCQCEFGHGSAAKGFEMGAAAEGLSHVVGDGAHVGAGGDVSAELSVIVFDFQNFELLNFHLDRLELDFLLLAREFVGRDALNLLSGKRRRHLLDDAAKARGQCFELIGLQGDLLRGAGGRALGVVGVGGESEADGAFVDFFGVRVELGEAGEVSDYEGKNACGHGVEGTEMSDGTLVEDAADAIDDVVRSEAGGLVENEDAVHGVSLVIW